MIKLILVLVGHLFVAIGVIGIFVPLLPTTPFLLLAAGCYARGSERLYGWLRSHPRLGPVLVSWQDHGVIKPRAKIIAVSLIALSIGSVIIFRDFDARLKACAGGVGALCIAFITTRPSRPQTPTNPASSDAGNSAADQSEQDRPSTSSQTAAGN